MTIVTRSSVELARRFALLGTLACVAACTGFIGAPGGGQGQGGLGASAGSGDQPPATSADSGGKLVPGLALRRLPVRELEATLDTLFPEIAGKRRRLPPDAFALFDNQYESLDAGLAFLENVAVVASGVTEALRTDGPAWARVTGCSAADSSSTCLGTFFDAWAPRLLRRPPSPGERESFVAMGALDLGTRDDVLAVGLESLLRHSEFLYRVELGEGTGAVRNLLPHELLSRLSFYLWGEAPDDGLRAKAVAVSLLDAGERRGLAAAMLEDPRSRRQLRDFHAQWLGYATMSLAGVGSDMRAESDALVDRAVFGGGSYDQLFLSRETYLTPALALHYRLPPIDAPGWVSTAGSGRQGIIGHGSFLSAFANVGDTSPVKRGKAVNNRLLCRTIEIPENEMVNVDAQPSEDQCRIDFFRDTHATGGCAGCHALLDGVGFGLERFDRLGVPRDSEQGKPHCALDGKGALDGVPFEGPAGLATALAAHTALDPCAVTQLTRFYLGTDPASSAEGQRLASTLGDAFAAAGRDFRSLVLAVIESPEFAQVAPR